MPRNVIHCCTSFGKEGLKLYATAMVNGFIQHWPRDVQLIVYLDDMADANKLPTADNVTYKLLDDPHLMAFKTRHAHDPRRHGLTSFSANDSDKFGKNSEGNWKFQYDAVRFSHKVFAFNDCARSGCELAIWLDGDTKTFSTVTRKDINEWLPQGKLAGFLERKHSYTETGFHIFDMTHPKAMKFFDAWTNYYKNDSIFALPAHTDCHTYDAARRQFNAMHWHSLSPEQKSTSMAAHVFINGPLGHFMDHMKGKRKLKGRSSKGDLFVKNRNESYWKE